ncbi:MAG: MerR family transcriptional regulator [Saprospiraceae bacterium]|nr:MerR family transcriptional regulator [Saprospiraceae bacterium]
MANYLIKDLERLSGIKAHTIRIWERRFGFIKPKRSTTNIRCYCEEDLKMLLNVALLNKHGLKISKISTIPPDQIEQKVEQLVTQSPTNKIEKLTSAMMEIDIEKADLILSSEIEVYGMVHTLKSLIHPFLEKVGLLWLSSSITPIQENFALCLIRRKIIAEIDNLATQPITKQKSILLFLPEGESQEIGILSLYYILKSKGYKIIYVGGGISLKDLKDFTTITIPNIAITMITETFTRQSVQNYINCLSQIFSSSEIYLTGYQVIHQDLCVKNLHNINLVEGLDAIVKKIDYPN